MAEEAVMEPTFWRTPFRPVLFKETHRYFYKFTRSLQSIMRAIGEASQGSTELGKVLNECPEFQVMLHDIVSGIIKVHSIAYYLLKNPHMHLADCDDLAKWNKFMKSLPLTGDLTGA